MNGVNLMPKRHLPVRHLSVRVPWHDTAWDGRVCQAPNYNSSCLALNRIAESKDDEKECGVAGQSIKDLPQAKWPCCIPERMAFMADFEYDRVANHPYKGIGYKSHQHFEPTNLRHPAYSAACVPFNWMFNERLEELADQYEIDISPDYEPEVLNQWGGEAKTGWVQSRQNQLKLLDCFFDHVKPEESLVFFYAKQIPFVDTPGRVLIGAGRVTHVGKETEYRYSTDEPPIRALLWERMVQHTIRPEFKDGFILPYHLALQHSMENPEFDPSTIAAMAPSDRFEEFSFATEHVTHDGAIDSLLACAKALRVAEEKLPGNYRDQLTWIDKQLNRLWTMRGPCPGLGAALLAFGVEFGHFVAREIETKIEQNEDPWPLVEKCFDDPTAHLSTESSDEFTDELCQTWTRMPEERRTLLKLLSRFALTEDQAKLIYVKEVRSAAGMTFSDADIIENPYRIFELTRLTEEPVGITSMDHGVFPDKVIREKHPLPKPSALKSGTDGRRVRALSIAVLEGASDNGDTLMPRTDLINSLRDWEIRPKCEVTGDLMSVVKEIVAVHGFHVVSSDGALP